MGCDHWERVPPGPAASVQQRLSGRAAAGERWWGLMSGAGAAGWGAVMGQGAGLGGAVLCCAALSVSVEPAALAMGIAACQSVRVRASAGQGVCQDRCRWRAGVAEEVRSRPQAYSSRSGLGVQPEKALSGVEWVGCGSC